MEPMLHVLQSFINSTNTYSDQSFTAMHNGCGACDHCHNKKRI